MKRLSSLSIAVALCAFTAGAMAQNAPAKPAAKKAVAKKPVAKSSKAAKAAPAAAATATATAATAALSSSQLETAKRVYTGNASCEFDQHVSVDPIDGKPGMFKVGYKNKNYTMVPEDTTTGAVRLEDKMNGVVWLQIPNKSMLMNSKVGQRMVDNCMHPSQKS